MELNEGEILGEEEEEEEEEVIGSSGQEGVPAEGRRKCTLG